MSNVIEEIMRFQTERELDKQKYCYWNESVNILEELLEGKGLLVYKHKRGLLKDYWEEFIEDLIADRVAERSYGCDMEHESVDYLDDIRVLCIGATMKQGYDPRKTLEETGKEINSREGKIENGKFQKFTHKEAKAKWYKADYTNCTLDK